MARINWATNYVLSAGFTGFEPAQCLSIPYQLPGRSDSQTGLDRWLGFHQPKLSAKHLG